MKNNEGEKFELATLGGGCFWCTEAVFQRLKGVDSVTSGYAGDGESRPTYETVSSGETDYTEAIQIKFDPKILPYDKLLEVFWATHDPTSFNRQGHDVGPQYRSVVFYHNPGQQRIAEESKDKLENSGKYLEEVVTSVEPFINFYPAEEYHKNFYENNRSAPYCKLIINPKIQKLYQEFAKDINEDYSEDN